MTRVNPELVSKVQFNCDLSDARFAGNYSLCIYLLKMREFYRWHHGLSLRDTLAMPRVSEWVHRTENRWDEIESLAWQPVPVNGKGFDVFDDEGINRRLVDDRVVFSGGIGRFGKPVFFLGECLESRTRDDLTVYICGREFARELAAPPAMIRGRRIFLRRQSIERMMWEAIEEWRWHRHTGPMERVHAHYGFERDPDAALSTLTDDQVEQLLLHEQGEYRAGDWLQGDWNAMLLSVASTRAENVARAVRDCLADCLVVLPRLVDAGRPELVHLYFALFTALGRELFPDLVRAYRQWTQGAPLACLAETAGAATAHFARVGNDLLDRHRRQLPVVVQGPDSLRPLAFGDR